MPRASNALPRARRLLPSALALLGLLPGRVHGSEEVEGQSSPRTLQVALPLVSNVDFQDLDLNVSAIKGTVSWVPPADVSEVIGYDVYLTDSIGTASVQALLGFVPVGENSLEVPPNTSLISAAGNRSHIFVFTKSPLGTSPQGVGVELCDVGTQDSIFLVNAEASTAQWGVIELAFFEASDCSGDAYRWAKSGSTGHYGAHAASNAFDRNETSAWVSSSATFEAGAVSLGVVGVCRPGAVRCVRLQQCIPNLGESGCPVTAGRLQQLRLIVQGEDVCNWRVLKGLRNGNEVLREELLVVAGRRRRAAFVRLSESPPRPEQYTNPGFSSR